MLRPPSTLKWRPNRPIPKPVKHTRYNERLRMKPVTVCLAALCEGGSALVAASDRMVTLSDVEFEPDISKIISLGPRVFALCAGATNTHTEITNKLKQETGTVVLEDQVSDIAYMYADYHSESFVDSANLSILGRYGLTMQDLTDATKQIRPEIIQDINASLQSHRYADMQALICGIDAFPLGHLGHIYKVESLYGHAPSVTCWDSPGFAAIGSGAEHALSSLMLSGHTLNRSFKQTLMTVFIAKKRAEIASGVGKKTDLFIAGKFDTGEISIKAINSNVLDAFETVYQTGETKRELAERESLEQAATVYDEIDKATIAMRSRHE